MTHTTLIVLAGLGGALVLAGLGAALLLLRNAPVAARRVESLFPRPPKPARAPGRNHYYKPYWS